MNMASGVFYWAARFGNQAQATPHASGPTPAVDIGRILNPRVPFKCSLVASKRTDV